MEEYYDIKRIILIGLAVITLFGLTFKLLFMSSTLEYTNTCWGTVEDIARSTKDASCFVYVIFEVDDGTDKTGTYRGRYNTTAAPAIGDTVLLMATENYKVVKPFDEDKFTYASETEQENTPTATVEEEEFYEKITAIGDKIFEVLILALLVVVVLNVIASLLIHFYNWKFKTEISNSYANAGLTTKLQNYLEDMCKLERNCNNKTQREMVNSTYKLMCKKYKHLAQLSNLTVEGTKEQLIEMQNSMCLTFEQIVTLTSKMLLSSEADNTISDELQRVLKTLEIMNVMESNGGKL